MTCVIQRTYTKTNTLYAYVIFYEPGISLSVSPPRDAREIPKFKLCYWSHPKARQGKVSCRAVGAVRSSRSTVPCGWDMIITSCGTAALSFKTHETNTNVLEYVGSLSKVYTPYVPNQDAWLGLLLNKVKCGWDWDVDRPNLSNCEVSWVIQSSLYVIVRLLLFTLE